MEIEEIALARVIAIAAPVPTRNGRQTKLRRQKSTQVAACVPRVLNRASRAGKKTPARLATAQILRVRFPALLAPSRTVQLRRFGKQGMERVWVRQTCIDTKPAAMGEQRRIKNSIGHCER